MGTCLLGARQRPSAPAFPLHYAPSTHADFAGCAASNARASGEPRTNRSWRRPPSGRRHHLKCRGGSTRRDNREQATGNREQATGSHLRSVHVVARGDAVPSRLPRCLFPVPCSLLSRPQLTRGADASGGVGPRRASGPPMSPVRISLLLAAVIGLTGCYDLSAPSGPSPDDFAKNRASRPPTRMTMPAPAVTTALRSRPSLPAPRGRSGST